MNEIQKLEEKREELKREVGKLDIQIKELEEQEKKCKRWRGNQNEKYWYISSDSIVNHTMEMNDDQDDGSYEIGNYFRTEEEAEKAVEKIKIYMQLKDLALRLNKGKKIDRTNSNQYKYHIYYEPGGLATADAYCYQDLGQIYCTNSDFLEIAKQEIGEENLKKLFE